MYETLLPWVEADGKIYSIPMQADVSVMYARLDLIEEATGKRAAPTTLDELEQSRPRSTTRRSCSASA